MEKIRLISLFVATGLPMLGLAPASAQAPRPADAAIQQIFGASGSGACFKRRYDAGHLATHPQQNVTAMLLLISSKSESGQASSYSTSVGVNFRKRGPQFEVTGYCSKSADGLDCGVECDGGSIDVSVSDGQSVLVKIPGGARLSQPGKLSEDGVRGKTFGPDDKVFRLDRTKLTDCLSIVHDAKTRATLRRGG